MFPARVVHEVILAQRERQTRFQLTRRPAPHTVHYLLVSSLQTHEVKVLLPLPQSARQAHGYSVRRDVAQRQAS